MRQSNIRLTRFVDMEPHRTAPEPAADVRSEFVARRRNKPHSACGRQKTSWASVQVTP